MIDAVNAHIDCSVEERDLLVENLASVVDAAGPQRLAAR
jgi:hypothetical protein